MIPGVGCFTSVCCIKQVVQASFLLNFIWTSPKQTEVQERCRIGHKTILLGRAQLVPRNLYKCCADCLPSSAFVSTNNQWVRPRSDHFLDDPTCETTNDC